MLGPSGHIDTFTRDRLPPPAEWPEFLLERFQYPDYINAAVELTDRMVEKGFGDHTALIGNGRLRTYKELADWTNRIAHVLVEDYGIKPGNRVMIHSANNPAMVACWLAATKAGAVVVNTMPMLRAMELDAIVNIAGFGPPTLVALGARVGSTMSSRVYNLVITNVPGPQRPLYAAGSRMVAAYPCVPLTQNQALSIGLLSYDGGVYCGLYADRDAVPDLALHLDIGEDDTRRLRLEACTPRGVGLLGALPSDTAP